MLSKRGGETKVFLEKGSHHPSKGRDVTHWEEKCRVLSTEKTEPLQKNKTVLPKFLAL